MRNLMVVRECRLRQDGSYDVPFEFTYAVLNGRVRPILLKNSFRGAERSVPPKFDLIERPLLNATRAGDGLRPSAKPRCPSLEQFFNRIGREPPMARPRD
jgi:hypothetical protein